MNYPITPTHFFTSFIKALPSLNNQQKKTLTITTVAVGCFALYYNMRQTQALSDISILKIGNALSNATALSKKNQPEINQEDIDQGDESHVVPYTVDINEFYQSVLEYPSDPEAYLNLAKHITDDRTFEVEGQQMGKKALENFALKLQKQLAEWEETDSGNSSPKGDSSVDVLPKNGSIFTQGYESMAQFYQCVKSTIFGKA